jgi:hypothetical protein
MNVLNENIQETTIITNSKINNDVYVILYPNIDNDSNGLKLNKIVLIYPSYFKKNNGFVVSAAINKYIMVVIKENLKKNFEIKYSEYEKVNSAYNYIKSNSNIVEP